MYVGPINHMPSNPSMLQIIIILDNDIILKKLAIIFCYNMSTFDVAILVFA
jgi:hypothetical protein